MQVVEQRVVGVTDVDLPAVHFPVEIFIEHSSDDTPDAWDRRCNPTGSNESWMCGNAAKHTLTRRWATLMVRTSTAQVPTNIKHPRKSYAGRSRALHQAQPVGVTASPNLRRKIGTHVRDSWCAHRYE
jgi:hypothetical protein